MAIQHRRGVYTDFDPSRMLPGEYAVVLTGDPSDEDGYAVYMCFASGVVKRLVLSDQMEAAIEAIMDDLQYDSVPTAGSPNLLTSGTIKTALDAKQNNLTFDSTPTANSSNPVTSAGIKTALDGKQDGLTFDNTPTANSDNPVKSGGIKTSLDALKALINKIVPEWSSGALYDAGRLVFHDGLVYRKKDKTPMTEYVFSTDNWEQVNASAFLTKWLRTFAVPYQDRLVSYAVGDLCIYNAQLYICIVPITGSGTSHPFDASEWQTTAFTALLTHHRNQILDLQENKQDNLTFDSTPTAGSTNPVTSGGVKTYVDDAIDSFTPVTIDSNGIIHF